MQLVDLSPEQRLLLDSAERYTRDRYTFVQRAKILASPGGCDAGRWRDFAELGWLGLPFPEAYGGSGGAIEDVMVLMQPFGKALVVEPYLSTVLLGGLALINAGENPHAAALLPRLISGELQMALAFAEPRSGYHLNAVDTTARADGETFILNGHKALVLGGAAANAIIVSARTSGSRCDPEGISLFVVPAPSAGLKVRSYATIDGRQAADIQLDNLRVDKGALLGPLDGGLPVLEETILAAALALLGEAIGILDGALEMTVDYLNTREQFGAKLATYQALRHRIAEMVAIRAEAVAIVRLAIRDFMSKSGSARTEAVAAAKAFIGKEGKRLCEEAIQLHGAIAITDEYKVGHYLKRLVVIDRLFGDVDHQIDRFISAFASARSDIAVT